MWSGHAGVFREGGFQEAAKKRGSLQLSPPCHGSSPSWPQRVQCPGIAIVAGIPPQLPALPQDPFPAMNSPGNADSMRDKLGSGDSSLLSPDQGVLRETKHPTPLWSLAQINVSSSDQPLCTSTQPAGENQTSKGRKSPEQDIAINRSSGDGDEMEN